MGRGRSATTQQKRIMENRKRQKRKRKRDRRRRRERMEYVTKEFGQRGAVSCGKKVRYPSRDAAESGARLLGAKYDSAFEVYYCMMCKGWHLTSHLSGKEAGDDELRPSEVLQRAREATMRVAEIEAERHDLYERIGVQGHTYGFTPKNDVRDPMRHVDEMMDGTADLDMEKAECQRDIAAGWVVVDGLRAYDDSSSVKPTTEAEYVLARYYLYAKSVGVISRETKRSMELCRAMLDQTVGFCDAVGYARLAAAARGERDGSDEG